MSRAVRSHVCISIISQRAWTGGGDDYVDKQIIPSAAISSPKWAIRRQHGCTLDSYSIEYNVALRSSAISITDPLLPGKAFFSCKNIAGYIPPFSMR